MANETLLSIIGNLTDAPELRYTASGLAVANMTIASTPRVFDRQKNEWADGDPLFMRCSVWREFAEHVASSFTKGTRVIAQGRLKQKSYDDKEGNKRTSIELEIEEIGPSLRYATAQLTRTNDGGKGGGGQRQQSDPGAFRGGQADEPWGQPAGQGASGWATPGQAQGGASGDFDSPPF